MGKMESNCLNSTFRRIWTDLHHLLYLEHCTCGMNIEHVGCTSIRHATNWSRTSIIFFIRRICKFDHVYNLVSADKLYIYFITISYAHSTKFCYCLHIHHVGALFRQISISLLILFSFSRLG